MEPFPTKLHFIICSLLLVTKSVYEGENYKHLIGAYTRYNEKCLHKVLFSFFI